MKILLVTTSYPIDDNDPAGHFVRAEARILARQGHQVHVVAPSRSTRSSPEPDPSTPALLVHRAAGGSLFGWPGVASRARTNPLRLLHVLPFARAARVHIQNIGHVDRAIAHWIVPSAVPLLLDHSAPLEVVAHGADVRLLCALPRRLRIIVLEELLHRRTRFRFAARASLDMLVDALPAHLQTRLVDAAHVEPSPIELPSVADRASQLRASIDADARGFVVIVGRLIDIKRVDVAIEAAAIARIPLVVVGDGPRRMHLERVAQEAGARVIFVGLVSRRDALAWIAASSLLLHMSQTEAAPTVVREARALGVPVVATPAGDLSLWARDDPAIVLVDPSKQAVALAIEATLGVHKPTEPPNLPHNFR